jgi:hypothetical protein
VPEFGGFPSIRAGGTEPLSGLDAATPRPRRRISVKILFQKENPPLNKPRVFTAD